MSVSMDAREVLTHLNALGYRNISAEQLKEFIRDLKKLIKYETRIGALALAQQLPTVQSSKSQEPDIFNKLHDTITTSIKAKYGSTQQKSEETSPLSHGTKETKPRNILKEINQMDSAQNALKPPESGKPTVLVTRPKSATTTISTTQADGRKSTATDSGRQSKTPKSSRRAKSVASSVEQKENRMWIRPKIATAPATRTKDPVQLYQFYQKEWDRFKQQFPGENDHSELRWQIRHKMLGSRG